MYNQKKPQRTPRRFQCAQPKSVRRKTIYSSVQAKKRKGEKLNKNYKVAKNKKE